MKSSLLTLMLFVGLIIPVMSMTEICMIEISPDSRSAAYKHGEYISVFIDYDTDEMNGIRIFARPFTNGELTPDYSGAGSPVYFGSGTMESYFTINSGNVVIDEIRIEVFNADYTSLLYRMFIPARYRFSSFGVNHFTFSDDPELTSLLLTEDFTTSFAYNVSYPGGVKVYIRPFTNGYLTPDYSASGSNTYMGTGTVNSSFTINSGINVHVDALRVRITNADQSITLDEFFIPVNLYFSTVKITDMVPESGIFPLNNEDREIAFNYSTTEASGIRIFIRPWTNGSLTNDYTASGSLLYTGTGTGAGTFSVASGNQRIDHARIQAWTNDQSTLLLEMFLPVEYTFGYFLISDIRLCPSPPARLEFDKKVNIHYEYYNDQGMNALIFVRPICNGSPCPNYSASGSPVYPVGIGSASDYFTLIAGNGIVDQIRFQVKTEDQSTLLAEYFIPVQYQYGEATVAISNPDQMEESIQLFPNPATDGTTLTLELHQNQRVHTSILNLTGQYVRDLGMRNIGAEHPEIWQIDGSGLANGLYIVRIEGEEFTTTRKLIISK